MGSGRRRAPPLTPSSSCKALYSPSSRSQGDDTGNTTTTTTTPTTSDFRSTKIRGDGCSVVEAFDCGSQWEAVEQSVSERQHREDTVSAGVDVVADADFDVDVCTKKASELWHIHGRYFDLTPFLGHHPGGSSILEAMQGAEDITPVFESYHALAHSAAIRQSLEKFVFSGKIVDDVSEREAALVPGSGKQPVRYRWDEGGFYATLTSRVKKHFLEKHGKAGADPRKSSVNRFVKAPVGWYFKELLLVAVYVPLVMAMLGGPGRWFDGGVSLSGWGRAGAAVLAGAVLQSFSFCTLHDASHYGLLFKRPRLQEVLSRVCNAWTLWHHGVWVMHHVYGHHSFTGDPERDPDLVHARPYLRKSVLAPLDQYDPFLVRWQRILAPLFMMVMPGATLGQTQAYLRGLREGNLWHVSISAASADTRWYEYLTYALAVGLHLLGGNLWVSFSYFMGISVAYHLCVAPDHDTFESSIVNSIETKKEKSRRRTASTRGSSSSSSSSGGGGSGTNGVQGARDVERNRLAKGGQGGGKDGDVGAGPPRELDAVNETGEAGAGAGADAGLCAPCSGSDAIIGDKILDGAAAQAARDAAPDSHLKEAGRLGDNNNEEEEEEEQESVSGDDWGEVQVRHSGNFSNGNPLVTQAMGGINYQIEHHLFPSMSHMLYAEIAPIVRDACAEFSIPYNAHPSLWSAYKSYLKHLVLCSEMAGPS